MTSERPWGEVTGMPPRRALVVLLVAIVGLVFSRVLGTSADVADGVLSAVGSKPVDAAAVVGDDPRPDFEFLPEVFGS